LDLDNFAKSYVILGLRINKHIDGYVEHYYGPSELKTIVDAETILSPNQLLKDCLVLKNQLKNQGFEAKRQKFLLKNIEAMETIIRKLNGEKIPYLEQVERLFDFKPVLYEDEFFYNLKEKAENFYTGIGTLHERIKKYANQRAIPSSNLVNIFKKALRIAQKRTMALFQELLPDNEYIEVAEVKTKNWAMYNWYQGNFYSKIDINISKVYYWTSLLNLACHEGYPGHHTACAIRDFTLFRNKGYFEPSILLIYTPEMVIHEGMGEIAEDVIFDKKEKGKIILEEICPNPEEEVTLDILIKQLEIINGFRKLQQNLAYIMYVYEWKVEDIIKYSRDLEVISEEGIKYILDFISDNLWAPYVMIYQGDRLIIKKYGIRPSIKNFGNLLIKQNLPSDLL
jgi:hypothetical protein